MTIQSQSQQVSIQPPAGFALYSPSTDRSLTIASYGQQKRGKTHFALTAPDPIAVISLDIGGIKDVADKFHKTLYTYEVHKPERDAKDDWGKVLKDIEDRYYRVLDIKSVRTVVIDTATDLWEIFRMAKLGKLAQVPPLKYTEVNREFANFIRCSYDSHVNLILTHKVKKEYQAKSGSNDGGNWTGRYERAGFSDIDFLVQVVLEHDRHTVKDEAGTPSTTFLTRIMDCRQNPSVIGQELVGEDVSNYEILHGLIYSL